jgi:exopolysaccharide biosynthesis polyprenyl glycosylphosphotransferase
MSAIPTPAKEFVIRPEGAAAPSGRREFTRSREFVRSWVRVCFGLDAVMLVGAVIVSTVAAVRAGLDTPPTLWLVAYPPLVLGLLATFGIYEARLRLQLLDDLRFILGATAIAAMAVVAAGVIMGDTRDVGIEALRLWTFSAVYLIAGRTGLFWAQAGARAAGLTGRPTLLVGAGKVGRLTAKRLLEQPELGLRPIGFVDKDPMAAADEPVLPVLGASWDLEELVSDHSVEHVVFCFSTAPHHVLLDLLKRCERLGLGVSLVPRLFEKMPRRMSVEHLGGLPLLTIQSTNPRGWRFAFKYGFDRAMGAVCVLVALPLMAAAALAIRLSMGRPILYRQVRVGRDGRRFEMLKFRSMRDGAPAVAPEGELPVDTAPGGVEGNDRRTAVGSFLRRTSLDELPQLFNVLTGDMSLVGPRPERPDFVELFEESIYRYGERLRVKAGLTGWAQINGLRGRTSLADRVEWDNWYIENWSLWLDVKIMLLTLLTPFRFRSVE